MPSPIIRIAVLVVGAFAARSALAQDLPGFTFAEACRIDAASAVLRIVYEGGACETTSETGPTVVLDGTLATVTIPTTATAEICTMQIVPNNVQKIVAISTEITELDVAVLGVSGEPQARQTVALAPAGPDCAAPGEGGF